jgi:hypothetical protein
MASALKKGPRIAAAVSVAVSDSAGIAYAGPESSSVEFNFHDLDVPQSQLAKPPSQKPENPPPPMEKLPSSVNINVGRPVNISIGDSLDDVQTALGIGVLLNSARDRGVSIAQVQTLTYRSVRVFFDESKKVYRIRVDAPFNGKLGGERIIQTRKELDDAPGAPAKEIEAASNQGGKSFIYNIDASTRVRYDFDAEGRVITVFLLSGTMQINLGGS